MKLNKLMILLLCLVLCVSCAKKDEVEIAEYDAKMVCTYEFNEVIDDEKVKSTSNIYLDYNAEEKVTKAIYQSISKYTSVNESNMYEEIIKLYNSLKGISAKFYTIDDTLILEIDYDYLKIDLEEIDNEIGNILDDTSLFKQVKSLPISLEEFKELELDDYECEVK